MHNESGEQVGTAPQGLVTTPSSHFRQRMAAFTWFSVVLSILMLTYGYTTWHLVALVGGPSWVGTSLHAVAIAAFLGIVSLITGPLRDANNGLSRFLAWFSYLSFAFYTSTTAFLLPAHGVALLFPELRAPLSLAVFIFSLLLLGWGLWGVLRSPRVVPVTLSLPHLPQDRLTIVQLSDLHIGPTIRRGFVERVVAAVNALDADIVVLTGDIADGVPSVLARDAEPLSRMKSRLGCFYITGNHEYYSGGEAWVQAMRSWGWEVLLDEHRVLPLAQGPLVLAGVTDVTAESFVPTHHSSPATALHGAPAGAPRILLAHNPASVPAAAEAGADLVLSGHTHAGQYFPWTFFIRYFTPFVKGLHRRGKTWIYVNRGTGYWGPPLRTGGAGEISLISILKNAAPEFSTNLP